MAKKNVKVSGAKATIAIMKEKAAKRTQALKKAKGGTTKKHYLNRPPKVPW